MKLESTFEIKGWDVAESDGIAEMADISRATIRKEFAGEIEGTSVGYGLLLQTPEQTGGYVVIERVTGKADGREGSFVIQHYGVRDSEGGGPWYGDVVPGSGRDGFAGVTGMFAIQHDEGGAVFTWDLSFEYAPSCEISN
ncbi:MAG: DUF3224 domain-containing protein [Pyrinomonadaceae bacterium]